MGDILVFLGTMFAVVATVLPWWWNEFEKSKSVLPTLDYYRYFSDSLDAGWRVWLPWSVALAALACFCLLASLFSILRLAADVRVRALQIPCGIAVIVLWAVVVFSPIPDIPYGEALKHTFGGSGTWTALLAALLVVVGAFIAPDPPRATAAVAAPSGPPTPMGGVPY